LEYPLAKQVNVIGSQDGAAIRLTGWFAPKSARQRHGCCGRTGPEGWGPDRSGRREADVLCTPRNLVVCGTFIMTC
jgi:hypothetical protein